MSAFTQSPTTFIWRWLFVTCIWKQNDFQRIHTHCTSAKICCPMTVNSNWKLAKTEMKTFQTFGSCSPPLFNQSNQLPRVLQGFQSNWVVRNWPGRVSILRKLESRGTVWWIALWWHSAVPVSGLDANVHASIQLQKEKLSKMGENFLTKDIRALSLSRNHKMLLPSKDVLHVAFAITTGKISAWAMTCFLPDLIQSCTNSLGMLSPIKKLCCFQGSTSTAPWVTDCSESSTAPSVNSNKGGASDQDCTSLGLASISNDRASETTWTNSGVTVTDGPCPPNLWRSWQASCVVLPYVCPAA